MYYDDDAEEKAVLADQFLLEVEYRLKQAMNGDTQSAQILLQYLARLLWDRRQLPTAVSDWLADALNTAGREGSADKAFLLKRGRQGRKKSDMAERNLRIVLYVERLREQRVPLKDSRNRMGAFSIVGGLPDVNLSGDEVEVIYEEYQRLKKQRKGFFEEAKERLLRG